MAFARKWKPSKAAAKEYAAKMDEISAFCADHGIDRSSAGDSYYFTVNGQKYRVSNHTVEASNAAAKNWLGEEHRPEYHPGGRKEDTVYIHAGKTRIMEIYADLCAGYELDGRGNRT